MAKKTYTAVYPVNHDGKLYKPGEKVTMDPEDAAELVARGTLAEGKQAAEASTGMAEPITGQTGGSDPVAQQLTAEPGSATANN